MASFSPSDHDLNLLERLQKRGAAWGQSNSPADLRKLILAIDSADDTANLRELVLAMVRMPGSDPGFAYAAFVLASGATLSPSKGEVRFPIHMPASVSSSDGFTLDDLGGTLDVTILVEKCQKKHIPIHFADSPYVGPAHPDDLRRYFYAFRRVISESSDLNGWSSHGAVAASPLPEGRPWLALVSGFLSFPVGTGGASELIRSRATELSLDWLETAAGLTLYSFLGDGPSYQVNLTGGVQLHTHAERVGMRIHYLAQIAARVENYADSLNLDPAALYVASCDLVNEDESALSVKLGIRIPDERKTRRLMIPLQPAVHPFRTASYLTEDDVLDLLCLTLMLRADL